MKKIIITLSMFLIIGSISGHPSDSTHVLQICLDLEALQAYFPTMPDGSKKTVYLMERDVILPINHGLVKFDKPVIQLKRAQIVDQAIEAFFMFYEFELKDQIAYVKFGFIHGSIDSPQLVDIKLELKKTHMGWEISKSVITQVKG